MGHLDKFLLAVELGDLEQIEALILASPQLNVNQPNASQRTALYVAARHNQLAAAKLLVKHGAIESENTAPENSALTVAVLNQYNAMAHFLLSIRRVESKPLRQGPTRKHITLQRVEYILEVLLGLVDGIAVAGIRINQAGMVVIDLSNGHSYNLSLLLKHADSNHFMLTDSERSRLFVKQCEKLLGKSEEDSRAAESKEMASAIGGVSSVLPIYAVEADAIKRYTGKRYYVKMNALLRGMPLAAGIDSEDDLKRLFIDCMLAISGINKNVSFDNMANRQTLIRYESTLPTVTIAQMKAANQLVWRPGIFSFSEQHCHAFNQYENIIVIKNRFQARNNVIAVSKHDDENEVPFAPSLLSVRSYQEDKTAGKHVFTAGIVHGVEQQHHNQYLIELALKAAFAILKQPYKKTPDPWYGIARHNHALAHHVRACLMVEPVVEYFMHHAVTKEFRDFCDTIMPKELQMIKIMMVFSKTGRESEVSPDAAGLEEYMRYQHASAENMAQFMREQMGCDESTINYYKEIMINMGNPNYPALVTGDTDEEKQRKLYINHIAALAHKLDLHRVYDEAGYGRSMSGYDGTKQQVTDAVFIESSPVQALALEKIEAMALRMLEITGDNIVFSKHGIEQTEIKESEFIRCNTDINYCWQQCQLAVIQAMNCYSSNALAIAQLKSAIDAGDKTGVVYHLAHLKPHDASQFNEQYGQTPLAALITSGHNFNAIVLSAIELKLIPAMRLYNAFCAAVVSGNTAIALHIISRLANGLLRKSLQYVVQHGGDRDLLFAVLAAMHPDIRQEYAQAMVPLAIKSNCSLAGIQSLYATGCEVESRHVLTALQYNVEPDVVLYLFNKIPHGKISADIKLEMLRGDRLPSYAEALQLRCGGITDVVDVLKQHITQIDFVGPRLLVKALKYFPGQRQRIYTYLQSDNLYLLDCSKYTNNTNVVYQACKQKLDLLGIHDLLSMGKLLDSSVLCDVLSHNLIDADTLFILLRYVDKDKVSPLVVHYIVSDIASDEEKIEKFQQLIGYGVDINVIFTCVLHYRYSEAFVVDLLKRGVKITPFALVALRNISLSDEALILVAKSTPSEMLSQRFVLYAFSKLAESNAAIFLSLLVEKHYDINHLDTCGNCILSDAINRKASFEWFEVLLAAGALVTDDILLQACERYPRITGATLPLLIDHFKGSYLVFVLCEPFFQLSSATHLKEIFTLMNERGLDINVASQASCSTLLSYEIAKRCPADEVDIFIECGATLKDSDLLVLFQSKALYGEAKIKAWCERVPVKDWSVRVAMQYIGLYPCEEQREKLQSLCDDGLDISNPDSSTSNDAVLEAVNCGLSKSLIVSLINQGLPVTFDTVLQGSLFYKSVVRLLLSNLAVESLDSHQIIQALAFCNHEDQESLLLSFLDRGLDLAAATPADGGGILYHANAYDLPLVTLTSLYSNGARLTRENIVNITGAGLSQPFCKFAIEHFPLDSIVHDFLEILTAHEPAQQLEALAILKSYGLELSSIGLNAISAIHDHKPHYLSLEVVRDLFRGGVQFSKDAFLRAVADDGDGAIDAGTKVTLLEAIDTTVLSGEDLIDILRVMQRSGIRYPDKSKYAVASQLFDRYCQRGLAAAELYAEYVKINQSLGDFSRLLIKNVGPGSLRFLPHFIGIAQAVGEALPLLEQVEIVHILVALEMVNNGIGDVNKYHGRCLFVMFVVQSFLPVKQLQDLVTLARLLADPEYLIDLNEKAEILSMARSEEATSVAKHVFESAVNQHDCFVVEGEPSDCSAYESLPVIGLR
ncbi:MAG: SidE phosphodiesterase domain-containing protein [Coxiellaceae bacterium]|nr:SidE phosphodiesterase domain-containing protein [Coxiellaceae bacterium]